MEKLLLKAEERKEFGKNAMSRLRRAGFIPGVIYGANAPIHVSLDAKDFTLKFRHISNKTIVPFEVGGKKMEVLIQEFQHNIVTDKIVHVDFYEFIRTELVKSKVPLKFVGTPVGLREGGKIEEKFTEVEIESMTRFIPKSIEIDISGLKIGDSIVISGVKPPENVKFTASDSEVLVAVV